MRRACQRSLLESLSHLVRRCADELPKGHTVVGGEHLGGLLADHDHAALVLPLTTFGMTLASATRRPCTP